MKKIYQITTKKGKWPKVICAIVFASALVIINTLVVHHWEKLGSEPKALALAVAFYTTIIGGLWYAANKTITDIVNR